MAGAGGVDLGYGRDDRVNGQAWGMESLAAIASKPKDVDFF
jgi:hypothetical protein